MEGNNIIDKISHSADVKSSSVGKQTKTSKK